eukprot:8594623-Pyramimonas_sp.AAC.1
MQGLVGAREVTGGGGGSGAGGGCDGVGRRYGGGRGIGSICLCQLGIRDQSVAQMRVDLHAW